MTTEQNTFATIADKTIDNFMNVIDEILGGCLEADLEGGILTIELASGAQYIINKHAPSQQIWMSSPVSGASHFSYDYQHKKWQNTRGGVDLAKHLADELKTATGTQITL